MPHPPLSEQMRMGQALRRYVSYNPLNYFRTAERLQTPQRVLFSDVDLTDVSFYQKLIDFDKMKSAGACGTIVRAGQNLWEDPYFVINWSNAKKAGIPRGSYHFYDSRATPRSQADLYWSLIKHDQGELMAVADFEENYGGPYSGWRSLYDFLERLLSNGLPLSKLWIYTGYYYWLDHSPQSIPASLAYFSQFPLWLAWYTTNPANVKIPKPWTVATVPLWQWGTPAWGAKYGVQTVEIDMDKWSGDLASYQVRFGFIQEGTMSKYKLTNTSTDKSLRVRSGPSVMYAPTSISIPPGGSAEGDFMMTFKADLTTFDRTTQKDVVIGKAGDQWMHLLNDSGWSALRHMGVVQGTLVITPDTPPSPDVIASVTTSQEMVVTHSDGRVETFRAQGVNLPRV